MLEQCEGSHAVAAAVALSRPEVICAYPISPQTHIVEGLGEMVKSGALSRCGDEAPGLDIVPKRFDEMVPSGTDDAPLWYCVSDAVIAEVSADAPVIRPIFEPGDAMFFDDLFLHKTGSDPSMPNSRFALECWHFGATGFPGDYAPIAA